MKMRFFSQKTKTLKTSENQTNYKQLENTKTIESKENQNIYISEYIFNTEKENQKDKKVEDITKNTSKNITIARSLDYSCNPPKTITADDRKNEKRKGERNKNLHLSYETI